MKMCLILEGSYPYVHGGVSTWMHQYITEMKTLVAKLKADFGLDTLNLTEQSLDLEL